MTEPNAESPDEVQQKIDNITHLLTQLNERMEKANAVKAPIEKEIRVKYEEITALQATKRDTDALIQQIRREKLEAERLLRLQELEKSKAEQRQRHLEDLKRQSEELDEIIQKYSWGKAAMPHQIVGIKKMAIAKRMVLGDKPGLGKTLSVIGWADVVDAHKILAIVPNDIMGNFEREVRRWAPHRSVQIIGGIPKAQQKTILDFFATKYEGNIFMIVNYESWRKNLALVQQLIDVQFDTVIVDEAHMIKNMESIAYRGVKDLVLAENKCPSCGSDTLLFGFPTRCSKCGFEGREFGEFRSVKNFVPMTGTPILNKPQDFFPLLHLVNQQLFPSMSTYLNTYCEMDKYTGKWKFQFGMEERLANKISGIYLARDRDQAGVVLPKQDVQIHEVDLDPQEYPKQWEAYQLLKQRSTLLMQDLLTESEDKNIGYPVMAAIALITRQRQMMTWPAGIKIIHPKTKQVLFETDVEESVKLDHIERDAQKIVEDEGDRLVIFSQFKPPLAELEKRLAAKGLRVVRYDGDTPRDLRQEIQIDFDRATKNDDPNYEFKWDIVLANYKTGGVGLNLNGASQAIAFDEEWNPGKEQQAQNRIDRIGQTDETIFHIYRVRETIDIWMANLIQHKRDMISGFESNIDLQQELNKILLGGYDK